MYGHLKIGAASVYGTDSLLTNLKVFCGIKIYPTQNPY